MSKHISMIFPLIIIVHDSSITFLFELLRLVSVLRQHQLSIFRSDGLRNCQGLLAAAQQFLRPWGMESRHKDLSNMGIVENFKVGLNLNLCVYIYIHRYVDIIVLFTLRNGPVHVEKVMFHLAFGLWPSGGSM